MASDNEQDAFCSLRSSNCTACVLAEPGVAESGRAATECQWAGGNPSSCVARPLGNSTAALRLEACFTRPQDNVLGVARDVNAAEQGPLFPNVSGTAMLFLWLITALALVISLCVVIDRVRRFRPHETRSETRPKQQHWGDKVYPEERITDDCSTDVTYIDGLKSVDRPSSPSSPCSSIASTLTTLCSVSWPRPVVLLRPACPATSRIASKPVPPRSSTVSAAPIARARLAQPGPSQSACSSAGGSASASLPSMSWEPQECLESLPVPQPPAGPPPEGTRAFGRWLHTTTIAWSPRAKRPQRVAARSPPLRGALESPQGCADDLMTTAVPTVRTTGLRTAAATRSPVSSPPLRGALDTLPLTKEAFQAKSPASAIV